MVDVIEEPHRDKKFVFSCVELCRVSVHTKGLRVALLNMLCSLHS